MRYSPKVYAEAFSRAIAETPESERDAAVLRFLTAIKENGDLKKLGAILAATLRIFQNKFGLKMFTVESALPPTGLHEELRAKLAKEGKVTKETVRPALLAGVKITLNDRLEFDATMKRKIDKLFGT